MPKPDPANSLSPDTLRKPYDGQSDEYHWFREKQLNQASKKQPNLHQPHRLSDDLDTQQSMDCLDTICNDVADKGFSVYEWIQPTANPRQREIQLHRKLGLLKADSGIISGEDNLSLLEDKSGTPTSRFVPYSNRQMNWHTDGYYNSQEESVRCFTLYCIEQAAEGGALTIMNNALLLIALYDENPDWVSELSHPQAVMFPANTDEEGHHRPNRTAAVFSMFEDGLLDTRFTTRTRNIEWRTPETELAAKSASQLINDNPQWHTRIRLKENQGLITANMLHKREAFTDDQSLARRQILRGRYSCLPALANSALSA